MAGLICSTLLPWQSASYIENVAHRHKRDVLKARWLTCDVVIVAMLACSPFDHTSVADPERLFTPVASSQRKLVLPTRRAIQASFPILLYRQRHRVRSWLSRTVGWLGMQVHADRGCGRSARAPMPGRITTEMTAKFAVAFLRARPNRIAIITEVIADKVHEVIWSEDASAFP